MPPTYKVEEEPDYRQTKRSEKNTVRWLYWKRRSSSNGKWHERASPTRGPPKTNTCRFRWLHSVLYKSRGFFWAFPGSEIQACRTSHSIKPLFSFHCPAAVFHLSDFSLYCHPRNHWMWQPACRRTWIIKQNRDLSGAAHLQSAFSIYIFALCGIFACFSCCLT